MITGLSLHIPLPFTGLSIIGLLMSKPETAITISEQYTVDLTEMMTAMPSRRSVISMGTRQNAERSGSAGRIRTVTICRSIGPICGSALRLGLGLGLCYDRAISRSRRAAAADKMVAPPPPPFGPGPARRGTLYVTPEIVKNTDVQKNAEELQQGTSAAVIAGRQDDPGEAP